MIINHVFCFVLFCFVFLMCSRIYGPEKMFSGWLNCCVTASTDWIGLPPLDSSTHWYRYHKCTEWLTLSRVFSLFWAERGRLSAFFPRPLSCGYSRSAWHASDITNRNTHKTQRTEQSRVACWRGCHCYSKWNRHLAATLTSQWQTLLSFRILGLQPCCICYAPIPSPITLFVTFFLNLYKQRDIRLDTASTILNKKINGGTLLFEDSLKFKATFESERAPSYWDGFKLSWS